MTRPLMLSVVPVAVLALAACSHSGRSNGRRSDVDLQRDLKLASTSTLNLAMPRTNMANFADLETSPPSARDSSHHLVKGPGPDAVPSKTPDLKAGPALTVSTTQTIPQVQALAPASVPMAMDPVASVGHATAAGAGVGMGMGAGQGDYGGDGPGVIIRGGGVDGDHCEPMGRRGPVYYPMPFPMGGVGGGSRLPPARPSAPRRP